MDFLNDDYWNTNIDRTFDIDQDGKLNSIEQAMMFEDMEKFESDMANGMLDENGSFSSDY